MKEIDYMYINSMTITPQHEEDSCRHIKIGINYETVTMEKSFKGRHRHPVCVKRSEITT